MSNPKTDLFLGVKSWNSAHSVLCLIALTQGFTSLADLSLNYLYKDEFHLTPSRLSLINSLCILPWIIKPLWGFISDCCPIGGKRRAPYLVIFGAIGAMCWVCMATLATKVWVAVLAMLTVNIAIAFCNVIGEALVVEQSQVSSCSDDASRNVSMFFGLRSVGVLLTAYAGGLLLEIVSKQTVFLITASFPLILLASSVLLTERRLTKHEQPKASQQFLQIVAFVKRPEVSAPISFVFLFMIFPTASDALFFFFTNELKFEPEFMGRLKMSYGLASIIGIYCYNRWLKNVEFKTVFIWSSILCSLLGCSQVLLVLRVNRYLFLPDSFFCLFSGFLVQAVGEINTMPILVLCCRLCPKNIEGSMYALLMSITNFGGLISFQIGAGMMWAFHITETNFHLLWMYILFVNSLYLIPILGISLVRSPPSKTEEDFYETV